MIDGFAAWKIPLSVEFIERALKCFATTRGIEEPRSRLREMGSLAAAKSSPAKLFLSTLFSQPSTAHFSSVLFPFVPIGVEHGVYFSPVLTTAFIDVVVASFCRVRVNSIYHFIVLARLSDQPIG
jgi:hypothetical protein